MFESYLIPRVCPWALESPDLDKNYYQCWIGLRPHFSPHNGVEENGSLPISATGTVRCEDSETVWQTNRQLPCARPRPVWSPATSCLKKAWLICKLVRCYIYIYIYIKDLVVNFKTSGFFFFWKSVKTKILPLLQSFLFTFLTPIFFFQSHKVVSLSSPF